MAAELTCFGKTLRVAEFSHHSNNEIRLNNGSFGACPKTVLDKTLALQQHWLANPDDFWNFVLPHGYKSGIRSIANRLFANPNLAKDICLVDNLTVAVAVVTNSVVARIKNPNSVVLISTHTYNAVKNAIYHACSVANSANPVVEVITVDIPFPLLQSDSVNTTDTIVEAYRNALEKIKVSGKHVEIAFLDHITSVPCMLLPVREIIAICREYEVKEILVDGAHTPGQLDLTNVSGILATGTESGENNLGADYYCANLHKWCFAPPSVAFLWVSPTAPSRHLLHHPIPSHRYNEQTPPSRIPGSPEVSPLYDAYPKHDEIQHTIPLFAECAMLGTRDYSPLLVVPEVFRFIDSLGGLEAIRQRNTALRDQAVEMLTVAWNTQEYVQHSSLQTCSMVMIGCPAILGSSWPDSERIRVKLRNEYRIVIQKLYPVPGDRLYLRLSIAVYNTIEEFALLRDAMLSIVTEINSASK